MQVPAQVRFGPIVYPTNQIPKTPVQFRLKAKDNNSYDLFDGENSKLGHYEFGQAIKHKKGNFTIIDVSSNIKGLNLLIKVTPIRSAVQSFKSKMSVKLIDKNTSVATLNVTDPVKERAEDFLDAVIANYNKDAKDDKSQIYRNTNEFLKNRIEIITRELGDVEKTAEVYKKEKGVTDIISEAGLYVESAAGFRKSLKETETQIKVVISLRDFVKKADKYELVPPTILSTNTEDATSASALIEQYNTLILTRQSYGPGAGPKNSLIAEMESQLASIKLNIISSLDRLVSSLQIKRNDLANQQGVITGKISQIPTQEREYKEIARQGNIKEALYLFLLQKREESLISLAATASNGKIIDPGFASDIPVSPRRNIIYVIAAFLGLLLPYAIIYISDLLNTKMKGYRDIEKLSIPYLGDVPRSGENNEMVTMNSRSSTAESLRIIRTNLEFMLAQVPSGEAKTIFVTSTIPKEGKTFISVNLAATIALSGKKVLLIGMDVRNPKLDEYITLPSKGLTNYLSSGDTDINDYIIKHNELENFYILPPGIIPPNPAELLMGSKVGDMFNSLKGLYDYIIVDTAPVSLVTDTIIVAKYAHCFVYVTRVGHLDKNMLEIPKTLHKTNKLPNMAILLNDTNQNKG